MNVLNKKIFAYFPSWVQNEHFSVDKIDPFVATHFIFAFFDVSAAAEISFKDENLVRKFIALKSKNSKAKFILSVGGWNVGSKIFSDIAASIILRRSFASNALNACIKYGFDGFDMDWEYPGQRDSTNENDRENFVKLCSDLSNLLRPNGKSFTIAVGATPSHSKISYDIEMIHPLVDHILLMTYDFYGAWKKDGNVTGNHTALFPGSHDITSKEKDRNVDSCVNWWRHHKVPDEKLIVGLATYGRTFTLKNASDHGVNAPASGPGVPDTLTYREIQKKLREDPSYFSCRFWESSTHLWNHGWDEWQQVPYIYKVKQWISYDNAKSIEIKLDYVKSKKLGGVMWWSLDGDEDNFPLIRMAKENFNKPESKKENKSSWWCSMF